MQNSPKRNNGNPRQAERSETLIIPHVTKEMLALAQKMANEGKSRAEIEQALAALQPGAGAALHQAAAPAPAPSRKVQRGNPMPWQRSKKRTISVPDSSNAPQPAPAAEPEQDLEKTVVRDFSATATAPTLSIASPAPTAQTAAAPAPPAATAAKEKAPKAPRHAAPRTREEAQTDLNERIRADHIWLSNPVLVRGLGLAPVVGAAINVQNALMLCIAALILITATRGIAVSICHLTHNRFRAPIYAYTAALLYIPTYILLYELFGTNVTLLGIYLPIMVVEPAIVKRMEFTELESVHDAWRHGLNNGIGMCVALLLVGALRELLATGAVFGKTVFTRALLPLAAQTAGGFIIVGIIAALWCAVVNAYTNYKREEVRRLYADRKH